MSHDNLVETTNEKPQEDWMARRWRPMMGWMYMLVCTCDFIVFPVLWSLHQSMNHGSVTAQWQPLTLQGAGLFHMAMGAVLGIAAFGRTQEKMAGANNGGIASTSTPSFTPAPAPSFTPAPAPAFTPAPAPSFGAKPAGPGRVDHPEL